MDRISMIGNTGTYLDSPYHRYAAGVDLAGLPLTALADLPAVVVRMVGSKARHTVLRAAGIPIVEHLTGLEQVPPTSARFTAAPPRIAEFGTFPVRAYASVPVR